MFWLTRILLTIDLICFSTSGTIGVLGSTHVACVSKYSSNVDYIADAAVLKVR